MTHFKNTTGGGRLSRTNLRRQASHKLRLSIFAAIVAIVAAICAPVSAYAADHTVVGVSPRGTTIDLFDYWIDGRNSSDVNLVENYQNLGINADHKLNFGSGMGEWPTKTTVKYSGQNPVGLSHSDFDITSNVSYVNYWTSCAHPRTGIVNDRLGANGYPSLVNALGSESLMYLFSTGDSNGKKAFSNVTGLLQVDGEGYYYYDSTRNFAEFDETDKSFTLYDKGAVAPSGSSPTGQFFPFNDASEVFTDPNAGGDLQLNGIKSNDSRLNHLFGMHMSTRFVQQNGGHTDSTQSTPVTYEFSGDDDVWIFIDGVLVGDLGGIHDAASIKIDFSTGEVVINEGKFFDRNGNGVQDNYVVEEGNWPWSQDVTIREESLEQRTTLKDLFQAAGVDVSSWGGSNTLPSGESGTYHTLDFYYLERGGSDSNLYLKYNLVNVPESSAVKVSQAGDPLPGVSFTLYPTSSSYIQLPGADENKIQGSTNAAGEMVFTCTNDQGQTIPVSLDQLGDISAWWVLSESNVPDGYRSAGDVQLRFSSISNGKGSGVLLSSNQWATGAYSQAHVTATATTTVYDEKGNPYPSDEGTIFAVVFQKSDDGWYPVSGDAMNGWKVYDSSDMSTVLIAANENPYPFELGSGGAYQATIEELPGDINTYYYMIKNNGGSESDLDKAEYTVAYFRTSADSIAEATPQNTVTLNADPNDTYAGFGREFSVTLTVPNIKNELTLKKTDSTTGDPLAGASFQLYKDSKENGAVDEGEALHATLQTDENGELKVYSDVDRQVLSKGVYVLVESAAPEDYLLDPTPIPIRVDDDGVHVYAGDADDNVSVETSIGSLVYSMRSFAAEDKVDTTLHEVKAQPMELDNTDYDANSASWATAGNEIHYKFDDSTTNGLTYIPTDQNVSSFVSDAGWSRLDVTQCYNEHTADVEDKTQLDDDDILNALFTGDVMIHVTNDPIGTLEVSKTVEGEGADKNKEFTFTIELTQNGAAVTEEFEAVITKDGAAEQTTKIKNGSTFQLSDGETLHVSGLVAGINFKVTETEVNGYVASNTVNDAASQNGTIAEGKVAQTGIVSVAFTNTFSYTSVTTNDLGIDLKGSKELKNRSFQADDSFTFTIAAAQVTPNAPLPEDTSVTVEPTTGTTVDFEFGDITFDRPGEHRYIIKEVDPQSDGDDTTSRVPGVSYDTSVYRVNIVIVANADGTLRRAEVDEIEGTQGDLVYTANPMIQKFGGGSIAAVDTVKFVNTYSSESATTSITGMKYLDVKNSSYKLEDGDFQFTIRALGSTDEAKSSYDVSDFTADPNQPTPENNVDTNMANGNIQFDFAEGAFTQDMKGKTFGYEITETNVSAPDTVVNDATTSKVVWVTVGDDGQGHVTAVAGPSEQVRNDTETVNFSFTNTYQPTSITVGDSGAAKIEVQKKLAGHNWTDEYTFSFELAAGTNDAGVTTPMPAKGDEEVALVGPQASATASGSFGEITFERAGTYNYTVTENAGTAPDISYDGHTAKVQVVVTEDKETGTLSAAVTCDNTDSSDDADGAVTDKAAFTNTYHEKPTVTTTLSGVKKIANRQFQSGDTFTFTISGTSDDGSAAPLPSNASAGSLTVVPVSGNEVALDFGTITFDEAGTYTYTLSEKPSTVSNVSSDATVYTVEYVVSGTDSLTVSGPTITVDGKAANALVWTNTYTNPGGGGGTTPDPDPVPVGPSDPTDSTVSVSKSLTGRDLVAGEFSFKIEPATDYGDDVTPDALTGTVDASGKVAFEGGFTFKETGEYEFTVSEVLPVDDDPDTPGVQYNGVTYDESTYTITATVTKSGNKLSVTWDAADVKFENTYEPSETAEITFGAKKVLSGRDLVAGEFTFELVDAEGKVVATATNDAAGNIVFTEPVEFDEAGTFTYTIREVAGDAEGVTYDTAEHTAVVTVTDNGDGTLTATVSYDGTGSFPTFENSYEEPEEPSEPDTPDTPDEPGTPEQPGTPTEETPDTGDHTNAALPILLALGGAALISGALVMRTRRSK